jgi:hypothetical protein
MIDIDNGNSLLHFKAINENDFARILEIVEAASYSRIQEKTQDMAKPQEIDQILLLLISESQNLNELILKRDETGEGEECQSAKEITSLLNRFKNSMLLYHSSVELLKEQLQYSDLVFSVCLQDNNELRKDKGMDAVTKADFIRRVGTVSTPHSRMMTASSEMFQSMRTSFYGDEAIFYETRESYSLFNDIDANGIEEEEEDTDDIFESFAEEDEEDCEDRRHLDEVAVVEKVVDESSSCPAFTRRRALPHPTISMENVSIMSLLRTNVGKDLSQVAMPLALNEPLNLLQVHYIFYLV